MPDAPEVAFAAMVYVISGILAGGGTSAILSVYGLPLETRTTIGVVLGAILPAVLFVIVYSLAAWMEDGHA